MRSKREGIVYTVIALWIGLGILGIYKDASLSELAAYFLSLTGFVTSYIWAETKRKSVGTSWWKKGKNSKRQIMIYVVTLLWAVLGSYGIWNMSPIVEFAAYFASLTPFVGAWIMGETSKVHTGGVDEAPDFDGDGQPD